MSTIIYLYLKIKFNRLFFQGGITMTIHIIKTDEAYENALARIEQVMDAEPNTPEGDELELLSLLVEKYEKETYPLPEADPVDVIQYHREQMNKY